LEIGRVGAQLAVEEMAKLLAHATIVKLFAQALLVASHMSTHLLQKNAA
jgi:hypothetical protein